MDSMAASIGISVFNIALTIVNVGVIWFWIRVPRRSGATMRWFLPRTTGWENAIVSGALVVFADAPCGGRVWLACQGGGNFKDAAAEEPDSKDGVRVCAQMLACPFRDRDAFACPLHDRFADGDHVVRPGPDGNVQLLSVCGQDPDGLRLEWHVSDIPYFELPPFAPFLRRAKAKRRACLRRGLRSRFVGGSPDCGEDERRHARNGSDDCEKKRGSIHAAESSTNPDRLSPDPATND